jgi:uncharacterized protein
MKRWANPRLKADQARELLDCIPLKIGPEPKESEVLTHFSGYGRFMRQSAAAFIRNILADRAITVREQSAPSFLSGPSLYEARLDKAYSLADCVSMQTIRQDGLPEILTHDDHFTQEGFVALL